MAYGWFGLHSNCWGQLGSQCPRQKKWAKDQGSGQNMLKLAVLNGLES